MSVNKPNLNRVWANGAPTGNVVDPDTTTPNKFDTGWQAEIPPFEHFNFIQKMVTQALAHINERGVPEWDSSTVYLDKALVRGSDGEIYQATEENSNSDPISKIKWKLYILDDLAKEDSDISLGGVAIKNIIYPVSHVKLIASVPLISNRIYKLSSFYESLEIDSIKFGGQDLIYDANRPKSEHNGGTVIDPLRVAAWDGTVDDIVTYLTAGISGTGCFIAISSEEVNPACFGFTVGTEVDMQPVLQAAADATPAGGVFRIPNLDGTAIIDIPNNGQVIRPAILFNKKVHAIGAKNCILKVKDFCTGWASSAADTSLWVIVSKASYSLIEHFNIDCNGSRHYETDGSGFKWWEAGPTSKRPPNGIAILTGSGEINNKNSVVRYNTVRDCLGGVAAVGGMGADLFNTGIFDQSLTTGLVDGAMIYGNTIEFSRGNGTYAIAGVINSDQYDNRYINCMYHPARIYAGCDNCTIRDNKATVDYRVIKSRYNDTDLGYWRTNDTASASYGIPRAGYRIGAALAAAGGDSNNANCAIDDNELRITGHITAADILSTAEQQFGADLLLSPRKNSITNNRFYGGHISGVGAYFETSLSGDNLGSYISDNKSFDLQRRLLWLQANKMIGVRNYGYNCGQITDQLRWTGDNNILTDNEIYAGVGTDKSIPPFTQLNGSDNFVTDNYLDRPEQYTSLLTNITGSVLGSNVRGLILTLLNSWTNEDAASTKFLTANKNKSGEVTITGTLSAVSRTNALVATLPIGMRPRSIKYFQVFQRAGGSVAEGTTYGCTIDTDGSFFIIVTGTLPDRLSVNLNFNISPNA